MVNIFCINLDHRIDRLNETKQEFEKLELDFERISAVYNEKRGLGCTLSHIKCIEIAKQKNYNYCVVCEDDIKFEINKHNFNLLIAKFLESTSDVLIICGNHFIGNGDNKNITNYNDYFYRTTDTQTTTCYAVKQHYYDKLLDNYVKSSKYLSKCTESRYYKYSIDSMWKLLQKNDSWLIPKIYCGTQRKSYSDIEKRIVDYTNIFKLIYMTKKYVVIKFSNTDPNKSKYIEFGQLYSKQFNRTLLLDCDLIKYIFMFQPEIINSDIITVNNMEQTNYDNNVVYFSF